MVDLTGSCSVTFSNLDFLTNPVVDGFQLRGSTGGGKVFLSWDREVPIRKPSSISVSWDSIGESLDEDFFVLEDGPSSSTKSYCPRSFLKKKLKIILSYKDIFSSLPKRQVVSKLGCREVFLKYLSKELISSVYSARRTSQIILISSWQHYSRLESPTLTFDTL